MSQCEGLDGQCAASWCNCDEVRRRAGSLPATTGSEPQTKDGAFERATDELHDAARHFVMEWIKAPRDSSFNVWFAACERLELAAVEYANAKAQNSDYTNQK
jgi:hypothetical protein